MSIATLLGSAILVSTGVAYAADEEFASKQQRINEAIAAYAADHPGDYVGLNKAAKAAGSEDLSFQVQGSEDKVSAAEVSAAAIDADAFTVSGYWSKVSDSDGTGLSFFGEWDFKVFQGGGSHPDDAFGLAVDGMKESCFTREGDGSWARSDLQVNQDFRINLEEADFDSAVFGVEDSAGTGNVDHGGAWMAFKMRKSCSGFGYGKAYYEHNRGGCNCGWSVGISTSIFNVTYTGAKDVDEKRKKATSLLKVELD